MHKLSGASLITEVSCADKGIPRDAATDGKKTYREDFQCRTAVLPVLEARCSPCHRVPWALQEPTSRESGPTP